MRRFDYNNFLTKNKPQTRSKEPLVSRSISDMQDFFQEKNHDPSEEMWQDIRNVLTHMEKMACGRLDPKYYLVDLAPGVGKTTAITSFVRNLLASPEHVDVGVMICVPLLSEIETLIEDLKLSKQEVGVYTSNQNYNALGCDDPTSARVLLTTQQKVEALFRQGRSFRDIDELQYNGEARSVRLWDEALTPWDELSIDSDAILRMPSIVKRRYPELAKTLRQIGGEVSDLPDNSAYKFPDVQAQHELQYFDIQKDCLSPGDGHSESDRVSMRLLFKMSGKTVRVKHDPWGNTILDWEEKIPDDFQPLIIFDASGRVRTSYEYFGRSRGTLETITTSKKYANEVTFYIWDIGGGKNAWRQNYAKLVQGIANEISREPGRECLLIHHKENPRKTKDGKVPNIPDMVEDLLSSEVKIWNYRSWGNHTQTNQYAHVDKVILGGALFLPPSAIEIRARASMGLSSSDELEFEDYKAIEEGELRNDLLQALNRGTMRRCDGNECAPMDAYIIASHNSLVPRLLKEMYPEAKFKRWDPMNEGLTGKVGAAIEYLNTNLVGQRNKRVSFKEVYLAIDMKAASFTNNVRHHPHFKQALEEIGIIEVASKKYKKHFQWCPH